MKDQPGNKICTNSKDSKDTGIVRRGRGQFRAPAHNKDKDTHSTLIDKSDNVDKKAASDTLDRGNDVATLSNSMATLRVKEEDSEEEKEEWEEWLDKESDEESLPEKASEEIKKKTPSKTHTEEKSTSDAAESLMLDEPTRVLDCSGFPSSYKTHNLHSMFRDYTDQRGGYTIKWMGDTRALIIFNHPSTAKDAYLDNLSNPLAKIQPYTGPVDFLKSSPTPPPRRPETSDMVARRLIHGALGVRAPARTPEQRKAEQERLQAVRDEREARRRQEALRKQAATDIFNA